MFCFHFTCELLRTPQPMHVLTNKKISKLLDPRIVEDCFTRKTEIWQFQDHNLKVCSDGLKETKESTSVADHILIIGVF